MAIRRVGKAGQGPEEQRGGSGEHARPGARLERPAAGAEDWRGQVVLTRGHPPCGTQCRPVGGAFRENLCCEEASSAASIPVGAPRTCKAQGRVNPECVCQARCDLGVRCLSGRAPRALDVWVGVRGQRVKESSMSATSCAFYVKGVGNL